MTKDDQYLMMAVKVACEKGTFSRPVNMMTVGAKINMRESGINNTVKLLAKANFIKKMEQEFMIHVTEKGNKYVETLLAKK